MRTITGKNRSLLPAACCLLPAACCLTSPRLTLPHLASPHTFNIRNDIPWGGLLNSSWETGVAANCELVWLASPLFDNIRDTCHRLGNHNNKQGFIILKRDVVAGEELRWKYSCSQAHRDAILPPSPTAALPSPMFSVKRSSSARSLRILAVPHKCTHHTICNPGKCLDCECLECIENCRPTGKRVNKRPSTYQQ